jgi:hypothetical protein
MPSGLNSLLRRSLQTLASDDREWPSFSLTPIIQGVEGGAGQEADCSDDYQATLHL